MDDKRLLEVYMAGFKDCGAGTDNRCDYATGPERVAYNMGWVDYIVGDDVRAVDYQTDEQILARIKGSR